MKAKYRALLLALFGAALLLAAGGIGIASGEDELPADEDATESVQRTLLPDARTANSNTFRLASGELQTEVFGTRVNFRDEDGSWKPIEEELEEVSQAGFTNGPNSFDLQLPEQMGTGAVRLTTEEGWISYRLLGEGTEVAEVDGAQATYESADGGVAFELYSLTDGLKEEIVLADPSQPSTYRFELDLAAGLTPELASDGSIEIRHENDDLFATIPAPVIADSGGAREGVTDPVDYALEADGTGGWTLSAKADPAWLSDPGREWPVTLDPGVDVNAVTNQDCMVGSLPLPAGWRECGSSTKQTLAAGYLQDKNEAQPIRAFLRFAMAGVVPSNAYINTAKLQLYSPNYVVGAPLSLETRRVTKSWDTSLNWERWSTVKPQSSDLWATPGGDFTAEGKSEVSTTSRGTGPGWWEFNSESLRKLVAGWTDGSIANQGLVVKDTNESHAECQADPAKCISHYMVFNSSGHSQTSTRPKLTINYYTPAPETSKVVSPMEGTTTARRLKLKAAWTSPGVTGVRFQYRVGKTGPFETIPPELVRDADGIPVAQWPVAVAEVNETEPLYFDAAHASTQLQEKGGSIQVRALFDGPIGIQGYSAPVEAKVDRKLGGPKDATAPVGPGTLNLMTGNLTISGNDVEMPGFGGGLTFSRTYNTREPGTTGEKSVLGQGWKPGVPVEEEGGSEWRNIRIVNFSETIEGETFSFSYAMLTHTEGFEIPFEKEGSAYITPPEMTGVSLFAQGTNQLVLADPSGTRTIFENSSGGSEYLPVSVEQTGGSGNKTKMVYQLVNGQRRLQMVIAPTPTFVLGGEGCTSSIATTETGCRALTFTYANASTWGAPSEYGDRLQKITYHAPGNGGPRDVASYAYDTSGRLIEFWDPRITPNLKETYTYESGKLRKVTPPGQEPWTLEYTAAIDKETGISRLRQVSRPTPLSSPSTAKTSIRYGVPISGSGAPYDLSRSAVSQWGQEDIPVDATAIYPPNEVPTEPATSYEKATIYYMDVEGFAVNTATPAGAGTVGASIATEETDEHGNVIRELTAQNRLRALAAGVESVTRSHQLATKRSYSPDGTELWEERGPLHPVTLESGEEVEARFHRTIQYDEGSPGGYGPSNPKPHLPTRETTGASIPGVGIDADQRVTEYRYNWTLRLPTETIVDPSGLNIRSVTTHHATLGVPIETRQPSEPAGGGAGTTKTIYYTTFENGDPDCWGHNQYAGLPCKILPAKQPETSGQPQLLVKRFPSYNYLGQPTEIIESPGGGSENVRKTLITYDTAGRQTSLKTEGGGVEVPKTETLYSQSNGMPTVQRFVCPLAESSCDTQAVTTTYDSLGRATSYEDADGSLSTVSYDALSRPVVVNDGKGTQTLQYDETTGLLVALEDSAAGTFTASYDADGSLVKRGLPNGLMAEASFDSTGAPASLTYTKNANCGESCTWLNFAVKHSIYGQIVSESGTLGTDRYGYDKAGRLISAEEAPQGGACTTRLYAYDANSNRTSMTTRSPWFGGACATSGGTMQSYNYDSADRLLGSGLTYDSFGRITALPSAYAGGGALTTSYFANDLVRSQTQDGLTNSYQLDSVMRQRHRTQTGTTFSTETYHYADESDVVAWIESGSSWSRNIEGIGGDLAAIQDSASGTTLQLANLHDDVVATASIDPNVTQLLDTFEFDEFGVPKSGAAGRFGWLGEKKRRTELPSGVIQMGVRSYVPAMGRFLTMDPVQGGSANAYDYAYQDPVNVTDLDGRCPACAIGIALRAGAAWAARVGANAASKVLGRTAGRAALRASVMLALGRSAQAIITSVARLVGPALYNFGKTKVGSLLFRPGGILNGGLRKIPEFRKVPGNFRIGFGRHDGHWYFRAAGKLVKKVTGKSHLDMYKGRKTGNGPPWS